MVVTVSSIALLAALTWRAYKRRKSACFKPKEKPKSLPRFTSGKVEKFYKGISKRQRPRISRNKEKLLKKQIETIVEDDQVTLVTIFSNLKKNANKIDVQEPVQNENVNKIDAQEAVQNVEIVEKDMIKSMIMTNFSCCNKDCKCSEADHEEPVQTEEIMEEDLIKSMEEIMEEDLIKSMVMTNFSGCNDDCNCSQAGAHTADCGLASSEDLAKLSEDAAKQPEAMCEENDDGDNGEDFETSNHYTSIKSKESILGNIKEGAEFEMFQNSTPMTFPSQKPEFVSKMQLSKVKTRKRPALELLLESPKPSPATNSYWEIQISKEVEDDDDDLVIDSNMKFETDSNTNSKETATMETFEMQDYEHPLGVWTPTDGSAIPPWKKDLLPPEPLPPSPHDHDTPRPDVSLLAYLDKFDQEEPKLTAIEEIIEKGNFSVVQNLSDSEEVVVSYNNFDVMRTTTAAIRKSSRDEDLIESTEQGLVGSAENEMSDEDTPDESIEDLFNYPAAKSDLDPSWLNTDVNMNENVTNSHKDMMEIDKTVHEDVVYDTPVRAATENETCTSSLFGISHQLQNRIYTNGNGSRSMPENDHNSQFNDNQRNNNQVNDGQQGSNDLLIGQGNGVQVNHEGNDDRFNDQGNEYHLNDERNDDRFNDQGNDVQFSHQGNDGQFIHQGNNVHLNDQGNAYHLNNKRNDDRFNGQGNDVQFSHQGNDGQFSHQGNDGHLNDQGNDERNDDRFNDQGNDIQFSHQGNDGQFIHQDNDGHLNDQRNNDRLNDQGNNGQFNVQDNDVQLNHKGNDGQFNDGRNDGQLNDKGNNGRLNDQGNNGQLNDQGHTTASDVGPVIAYELSRNDREGFEDNEVKLVTIKGDPKFISRTLHLLVTKENQDCEEGTTSDDLSLKSIPNKTAASKSHIRKAQGNQNTSDSQMPEKKISDEVIITPENEDSLGGPSVILHSTLPWHSPAQSLPASKRRKLRRNRKK